MFLPSAVCSVPLIFFNWRLIFCQVFSSRSWATVRVMSADQRASLKRIVNDDAHTKLSFKECEGIAKDLNLTLEQVCFASDCELCYSFYCDALSSLFG